MIERTRLSDVVMLFNVEKITIVGLPFSLVKSYRQRVD